MENHIERLRPCQICDGLNEEEVSRLAQVCHWQELTTNETLTSPSQAILGLFTVTRGRLRLYRSAGGKPRFIGYANLGDTVGQTSLLTNHSEDATTVIADMESQVAILDRPVALELVASIPRFRENLFLSLGQRIRSIFRGEHFRRVPRVVGMVSMTPADHLSSLIAEQLRTLQEDVVLISDRKQDSPAVQIPLPAFEGDAFTDSLRSLVRAQLADADRILIDVSRPHSPNKLLRILEECGEVFWCTRDASQQDPQEALLQTLVAEYPDVRQRITRVRVLPSDDVARPLPPLNGWQPAEFKVPSGHPNSKSRLFRQAIDRIIRHLRGLKLGIALGGGGARGLSHLGVLKLLDRAGISFDIMSGTSAGAMIGLGYAAGMSPDAMIELFSRELQAGVLENLPGGRRLFLFTRFRGGAWEEMLREHYHDWTFEQLNIPFSVVTTDLVAGEQLVRESGDIVHAILESINVPVMSEPILKDGKVLVDGGVLNNLPVELLIERGAEFVIGVDASKEIPNHFAGNHPGMTTAEMKSPGALETAYRAMEVSRRGIAQLQMNMADVLIEPDTSAFDFADFTAAAAIAEQGEAATEKMLPAIQQAYRELVGEASLPK